MNKFFYIFILLFEIAISQTLVQTIDLPNNNHFNYGYGMCYKDGKLWIGTTFTASKIGYKLFAVDLNGNLADSIILNKTHIDECYGITWDGTNFWWLKRYITNTRLFKVSTTGIVTDSINYPQTGWYAGGICFERGVIWVSVYYPNDKAALYKMRLPDGATIDTIRTRGIQPQGITVKGDTLFYVMDGFDGDLEKIYAVNLNTKDTLFSFKLPEVPGQRQNPRGLAWDGRYLYLLAEPVGASSGRKVFKYDLAQSGSPSINLLTKTLDFNTWYVDSTKQASIFIQNLGDAKLIIDSAKSSNVSFSFTTTIFPIEINPGQNYEFICKFQPNRYGVYSDSIMFYHNDRGNPPQKTKLSAKGIFTQQKIFCNETNYNFGQKKNNSTSLKDFIIENQGSRKLYIYGISVPSPFYRDAMSLYRNTLIDTIIIDSASSYKLRIWYKPVSFGSRSDSLIFTTNSFPQNRFLINIAGESIYKKDSLGSIRWQTMIPANPSTSYQDYSAAAIRQIPDVTGDGKPDIFLDAENYQLLLFNGNSSGTGDLVWRFNHGYNNNNTGKVERVGALQVREDVDNDGFKDIVVGLGGGNEFVYCLSGKTGTKIWEFGDSVNYQNGDINGIDCKRDFNNDGIPDVLATASGDMSGFGRYSIFCLNGLNGNIIFQISQASPPLHTSGIASTSFGGAFSSYSISGGAPFYVRGFNKQGGIVWTQNTAAAVWSIIEVGDIGGSTHSDVVAGDFQGTLYAFDGETGTLLWQTYCSAPFFTDLRLIPDVNGNGYPEVFGSGTDPGLYLVDSKTGQIIWNNTVGSILLGVSEIPDLNNDGYMECGATALGNNVKIVNGQNGSTMFEYLMGPGTNGTAAEKISALNDVDGDGFGEFVASARDGQLICFSGGTNSASNDSIIVISPNGNEKWTINTSRNIKWSATSGVQNVKIEYTTNGGLNYLVIISSTPANPGIYSWTVPNTPSTQCKVKISSLNNSLIFDATDNNFTITSQNCKDVEVTTDWNIVSVPLLSSDMSKQALFPTATSSAYGFNEGYFIYDTLRNGKGYWVKFNQQQTFCICGNNVADPLSIPVLSGWNLIGAYHNDVSVSSITSTPPNIINSNFYGYNGGYFIPTNLANGKGYWVKVTQNGNLILPSSFKKTIDSKNIVDDISKSIIITNKNGSIQKLYIVNEKEKLENTELPPIPPVGIFDARFSDNNFIAKENSIPDLILNSASYPVKIKVKGVNLIFSDCISGKIINKKVSDGEEFVIFNPSITRLKISFVEIPTKYSLSQNYPNPFNPITIIEYGIPTPPNSSP